jgi:hypothetical protein
LTQTETKLEYFALMDLVIRRGGQKVAADAIEKINQNCQPVAGNNVCPEG